MCGCHLFIGAYSLTQPATAQEMNAAHRFYHLGLVVWSERPVFQKAFQRHSGLSISPSWVSSIQSKWTCTRYSSLSSSFLLSRCFTSRNKTSRTAAAKIHARKEFKRKAWWLFCRLCLSLCPFDLIWFHDDIVLLRERADWLRLSTAYRFTFSVYNEKLFPTVCVLAAPIVIVTCFYRRQAA